jgi:hypothetical protein
MLNPFDTNFPSFAETAAYKPVVTFALGAETTKGFVSGIEKGKELFKTDLTFNTDFSGKFPQPNAESPSSDSSKPPEPSTRPYIWKKAL